MTSENGISNRYFMSLELGTLGIDDVFLSINAFLAWPVHWTRFLGDLLTLEHAFQIDATITNNL